MNLVIPLPRAILVLDANPVGRPRGEYCEQCLLQLFDDHQLTRHLEELLIVVVHGGDDGALVLGGARFARARVGHLLGRFDVAAAW